VSHQVKLRNAVSRTELQRRITHSVLLHRLAQVLSKSVVRDREIRAVVRGYRRGQSILSEAGLFPAESENRGKHVAVQPQADDPFFTRLAVQIIRLSLKQKTVN
jgi:lipoprotein NlpI